MQNPKTIIVHRKPVFKTGSKPRSASWVKTDWMLDNDSRAREALISSGSLGLCRGKNLIHSLSLRKSHYSVPFLHCCMWRHDDICICFSPCMELKGRKPAWMVASCKEYLSTGARGKARDVCLIHFTQSASKWAADWDQIINILPISADLFKT